MTRPQYTEVKREPPKQDPGKEKFDWFGEYLRSDRPFPRPTQENLFMTIETPVDGTFEWWMRQVDAEVEHMSGLTSDDMRDMNFRDRFNDGENPHDVAVELLESEGFQFPG